MEVVKKLVQVIDENSRGELSEREKIVAKACSADGVGPSTAEMRKIASMTFQPAGVREVTEELTYQIRHDAFDWVHIHKGLILIDFLIRNGSEVMIGEIADGMRGDIMKACRMQFADEGNHAKLIRIRARNIMKLLDNPDLIVEERVKAKQLASRCIGFSSDLDDTWRQPRRDMTGGGYGGGPGSAYRATGGGGSGHTRTGQPGRPDGRGGGALYSTTSQVIRRDPHGGGRYPAGGGSATRSVSHGWNDPRQAGHSHGRDPRAADPYKMDHGGRSDPRDEHRDPRGQPRGERDHREQYTRTQARPASAGVAHTDQERRERSQRMDGDGRPYPSQLQSHSHSPQGQRHHHTHHSQSPQNGDYQQHRDRHHPHSQHHNNPRHYAKEQPVHTPKEEWVIRISPVPLVLPIDNVRAAFDRHCASVGTSGKHLKYQRAEKDKHPDSIDVVFDDPDRYTLVITALVEANALQTMKCGEGTLSLHCVGHRVDGQEEGDVANGRSDNDAAHNKAHRHTQGVGPSPNSTTTSLLGDPLDVAHPTTKHSTYEDDLLFSQSQTQQQQQESDGGDYADEQQGGQEATTTTTTQKPQRSILDDLPIPEPSFVTKTTNLDDLFNPTTTPSGGGGGGDTFDPFGDDTAFMSPPPPTPPQPSQGQHALYTNHGAGGPRHMPYNDNNPMMNTPYQSHAHPPTSHQTNNTSSSANVTRDTNTSNGNPNSNKQQQTPQTYDERSISDFVERQFQGLVPPAQKAATKGPPQPSLKQLKQENEFHQHSMEARNMDIFY